MLPLARSFPLSVSFMCLLFLHTTQFLLLVRLGPNIAFREARISCRVLAFIPSPFVAQSQLTVAFLWNAPIVQTSSKDLAGQLTAGSQSPDINGTSLLELSSLQVVGESSAFALQWRPTLLAQYGILKIGSVNVATDV
ncbi:unnamed protein product [Schistocephalus solidus]|uniref:Secreted protein n=1 Tax=Schistocephalus solidus TaxID=70667 RepID=A0A183TUP2_SCHSO|nr:unnamed protein product [Schistocephalus solidus]